MFQLPDPRSKPQGRSQGRAWTRPLHSRHYYSPSWPTTEVQRAAVAGSAALDASRPSHSRCRSSVPPLLSHAISGSRCQMPATEASTFPTACWRQPGHLPGALTATASISSRFRRACDCAPSQSLLALLNAALIRVSEWARECDCAGSPAGAELESARRSAGCWLTSVPRLQTPDILCGRPATPHTPRPAPPRRP